DLVESVGLEGRHRLEAELFAENAVRVVHARLVGVAETGQFAGFGIFAGNGFGEEAGTASCADKSITLSHVLIPFDTFATARRRSPSLEMAADCRHLDL